jgi:hypothetical protein
MIIAAITKYNAILAPLQKLAVETTYCEANDTFTKVLS